MSKPYTADFNARGILVRQKTAQKYHKLLREFQNEVILGGKYFSAQFELNPDHDLIVHLRSFQSIINAKIDDIVKDIEK